MHRILFLVLATCALGAALIACDDDGGDDPTPAATRSGPTRAANSVATPVPGVDIRELDLRDAAGVQALIADTGGQFAQEAVIYADLTDDGVDEAIVPVASGGTLGDLGFVVLTPRGGGTQALVSETADDGGLALSVEDGVLVMTQGAPGPDDPECCPSSLRETRYEWNGAALAVVSVMTIPNPGASTATPSP